MEDPGGLNVWADFVVRPWTSEDARGEYREAIVNVRNYLQQLVLGGGAEVAVRAAKVLLDHPPLAPSTRMVLSRRFPQEI